VPPGLKHATAFVALICLSFGLAPRSASAVTVEVARKCSALADKAFPPRVIGNPAAGRMNGTVQDFQKYFNKCVANGSNMEEPASEQDKQKTPNAGSDKSGQAPGEQK
jgi:hypothetical protein